MSQTKLPDSSNPLSDIVGGGSKVDFEIACTGTPVENSLVDLWCLFDFI
ncbi:hypothetical protein [Psychrobacter sp. HII-4]|nr:hypothetical protein [Psychrobacter sp. HII-4]